MKRSEGAYLKLSPVYSILPVKTAGAYTDFSV